MFILKRILCAFTILFILNLDTKSSQKEPTLSKSQLNYPDQIFIEEISPALNDTITSPDYDSVTSTSEILKITQPLAGIDIDTLIILTKPEAAGSSKFVITNSGSSDLQFSIKAELTDLVRNLQPAGNLKPKFSVNSTSVKDSSGELVSSYLLSLDDGNNMADNFLGWGNGAVFSWFNKFEMDGFDFTLEQIHYFMRTEAALFNNVILSILDEKGDTLFRDMLDPEVNHSGQWYTYDLAAPISFSEGSIFFIGIGTLAAGIDYPAGFDETGSVQGDSYYWEPGTGDLVNINTVDGLEYIALLIRAGGKKTGGMNMNPVAMAEISGEAELYHFVTFDASQSYDTDGKIRSYFWDFGDGYTAAESLVAHSFPEAGTFTYKLIVTDNMYNTGGTEGQITIRDVSSNKPPSAVALISANQESVNIKILFDASESYDDDGEIKAYKWNFGDGTTGTEIIASHHYSSEGTFTYSLSVTDDKGAVDDVSGQIIITTSEIRLTILPENGIISPGEAAVITAEFNAEDLPEGDFTGSIVISSNGGNFILPVLIRISGGATTTDAERSLPGFSLSQNYPNPFNPETQISFTLSEAGRVLLILYDARGKEVQTLVDAEKNKGTHQYKFRLENLASGVYYYRLTAGDYTETKKLLLLR